MLHYKTCETGTTMVHTCDACNNTELGRVRSVFLIEKSVTLTKPLVFTEWTAAIEAGNIHTIGKTNGSFDGGTAKTGTGYGDETERKLGDDYVLSFKDPAYADNVDFWEKAEKKSWHIAFRSETKLVIVDNVDVKLTAKAPIEEDIESEVVWNVEAKWYSQTKPKVVEASPIKTLFECFEVSSSSAE